MDNSTGTEIRLLTYNLFLRPPLVKNNASDEKDLRLEMFLPYLKDYDILCLQEVFGFMNPRKDKLLKKAFKEGYLYLADSPPPPILSTSLIEGGLVILSRLPIYEQKYVPFKINTFPDSLADKGILYAKILVDEVRECFLHIFTFHTQACYEGIQHTYKSSLRDRLHQYQQLNYEFLLCLKNYNYNPEKDMIIMMGDLNLNARSCKFPLDYVEGFPSSLIRVSNGIFDEHKTFFDLISNGESYRLVDYLMDGKPENEITNRDITFGDVSINEKGEEEPLEVVLTHFHGQKTKQSLDYLIEIFPKNLKSITNREEVLQFKKGSCKVEKFLVDASKVKGRISQLSDHYGVSGIIKIKNLV